MVEKGGVLVFNNMGIFKTGGMWIEQFGNSTFVISPLNASKRHKGSRTETAGHETERKRRKEMIAAEIYKVAVQNKKLIYRSLPHQFVIRR